MHLTFSQLTIKGALEIIKGVVCQWVFLVVKIDVCYVGTVGLWFYQPFQLVKYLQCCKISHWLGFLLIIFIDSPWNKRCTLSFGQLSIKGAPEKWRCTVDLN